MKHLLLQNAEAAGHSRRVAALCEALAGQISVLESVEICNAFDEAVEFAALEGRSIGEAITAFFEEPRSEYSVATRAALAHLTGWKSSGGGSSGIDIAAIRLPIMPAQISRLLRTSNDATSVAELEDIAESDPVLAGKVVGAANSALFGSQFRIVRLREAILRLGIEDARKTLLAACFGGLFASKPLQNLWRHSQTAAKAACYLAPMANLHPETAWLAGLLHDIGRVGFMTLPAHARIREQEWLAAGFPVAYAETLAYGTDHTQLGYRLLSMWELPDEISEAVLFHHRPERSRSPLCALLALAEDLTATTQPHGSEDLWDGMRRTAACGTLAITPAQFTAFQTSNAAAARAYA